VPCCPTHDRYLVGCCVECGEVFRYRMGFSRHGSVHWLDQWNYCPSCGIETQAGDRVPGWMAAAISDFGGNTPLSREILRLAVKLTVALEKQPTLLGNCATSLLLPRSCDAASSVASAVLFALEPEFYGQDYTAPLEIRYFAMTGHPLSSRFPEILREVVSLQA
jgi:hypothetical protein